ncbi:GIY-YIG nuclease family protein [Agrobacterium cavarae]|uniref:GIY-YIG nuclease family protein n=1 Tax=Agrobacterium cavarae TaxID=2528239 RepID=UPI0028ACAF74|nr:GIY-YIG nuclease family protein [Agrobacterium cavarae]
MIFKNAGTIMPVWQISRVDPGYLYIVENHGKYKIGKSKRDTNRLKAAKTWLPDMTLIGQKPFWGMSHHERCLHTGFANYWYSGEWFDFTGDNDALDLLLEGFTAFSDDSPDRNSVDFIYWFNGEGMAEFLIEQASQKLSLPRFQKQESVNQKPRR